MKDIEQWPYVWTGTARPGGRYNQVCRIVKKREGQDGSLCGIRFKSDGKDFIVRRKGLKKRESFG